MKLYIPNTGQKIQLTKAWPLKIEWDWSTKELVDLLNPNLSEEYEKASKEFTGRCGRKVEDFAIVNYTSPVQSTHFYDHYYKAPRPVQEALDKYYKDTFQDAQRIYNEFRAKFPVIHSFPKGTEFEVAKIFFKRGYTPQIHLKWRVAKKKVFTLKVNLDQANNIEFQLIS
jgi:hypothetical protein